MLDPASSIMLASVRAHRHASMVPASWQQELAEEDKGVLSAGCRQVVRHVDPQPGWVKLAEHQGGGTGHQSAQQ